MAIGRLETEADVARFVEDRLRPLAVTLTQLQGGVLAGTGSPESVVEAPVSVLYRRKDGAPGTLLYQKQSGSGDTGWAAIA